MDSPTNAPDIRRQVIILANPVAGTQARAQATEDLVAALQQTGLEAVICREREDLQACVKERGERLRCVVAAGGDGTLNEVLNRVPGVPVTILPLGNENLVARHFHFQRSPADLAHTIAHAPLRQLDLARVEGRYFSVMAGAGLDAEVVHQVHARRSSHINKLHYILPIWRALRDYTFPEIEVEIEETGERLRGAMVFVFNLPEYGLRLPVAARARADDGLLDLVVFERSGVLNLARYIGAVMRRQLERLRDVKYRLVRRVHLRSRRPVPLQVDGDPAGFLPVTIEVAPGMLHLLAPEVSASGASPR
jgi:diacylglycerol kinase family enzyme